MYEERIGGSENLTGVASDLLRTGFSARADSTNGVIVLQLRGELDLATAPGLGQAINRALDARPSTLRLDLSALTFLDSTGIRVLIAGSRRAGAEGCSLVLHAPTRSVLKALRLTGVDGLMVIEADQPRS